MAFYCQCMLEMALILSDYDPMYEEVAFKFVQHFMWISYAMDRIGEHHDEMWDEQDGFFYDLLRLPDGQATRLKVRSLVGPAAAVRVHGVRGGFGHAPSEADGDDRAVPEAPPGAGVARGADRRGVHRLQGAGASCRSSTRRSWSGCSATCSTRTSSWGRTGSASLSRYHLDHPFMFWVGHQEFKVQYLPAESNNGMFGGNSNWRGPVWMPVNALIVRALLNLYTFYGDDFKVECPTGSGRCMTLFEVAQELARRLAGTFLRDADGRAAGLRRDREVPGRPALARPASCSTSTSTATTAPASAPATRPAGPAWSPSCSTSSGASTRRRCWRPNGRA